MVVANPAEVEEYKRPQVEAPEIDESADLRTEGLEVQECAIVPHHLPFTIATYTDDTPQGTPRATYAKLFAGNQRVRAVLCSHPCREAEPCRKPNIAEPS